MRVTFDLSPIEVSMLDTLPKPFLLNGKEITTDELARHLFDEFLRANARLTGAPA